MKLTLKIVTLCLDDTSPYLCRSPSIVVFMTKEILYS